jgi:hypothetical protein
MNRNLASTHRPCSALFKLSAEGFRLHSDTAPERLHLEVTEGNHATTNQP